MSISCGVRLRPEESLVSPLFVILISLSGLSGFSEVMRSSNLTVSNSTDPCDVKLIEREAFLLRNWSFSDIVKALYVMTTPVLYSTTSPERQLSVLHIYVSILRTFSPFLCCIFTYVFAHYFAFYSSFKISLSWAMLVFSKLSHLNCILLRS